MPEAPGPIADQTVDFETYPVSLRTTFNGTAVTATAKAAPDWTRQLCDALHAHLPAPLRDDWADRLQQTLLTAPPAGLGPVHTWYADTVLPLLATVWGSDTPDTLPALVCMHREGTDSLAERGTWQTTLDPILQRLYHAAYDREGAYKEAHGNAHDYALANGQTPAEADKYGHLYARLSTDANAERFAQANAYTISAMLAHAFATDSMDAYSGTYPAAQLRTIMAALVNNQGSEMRTEDVQPEEAIALILATGLEQAFTS